MGGAGADQLGHISIHALREEGDLSSWPSVQPMWQFLSTPSARRATARRRAGGRGFAISIHALREEGDIPCLLSVKIFTRFLSTPSARRATLCEL